MGNHISINDLARLERIEKMLMDALAEVCRVKKSQGVNLPAVPAKKVVITAVSKRRSKTVRRA